MNYWGAEPTGLAECAGPCSRSSRRCRRPVSATRQGVLRRPRLGGAPQLGHLGLQQAGWPRRALAGMVLLAHGRAVAGPPPVGAPAVRRRRPSSPSSAGGFARDTAWPAIRGAAEFALDLLVEFPDGTLGTSPSTSPENSFTVRLPGGGFRRAAAAESSTMDLTLIRDVFLMLGSLAEELGTGNGLRGGRGPRSPAAAPGAPPGRNGRLREWLADPEEWEPEHRHVSHLYLAYPGDTPLTPGARGSSQRQPGRPGRRIHRLVPGLEDPAPGPAPPAGESQRPVQAVLPGHGR